MRYICTSIVATLVMAGTSFAATINVPEDYATIQGAVDAAVDGDEIVVAPGSYTSPGTDVVVVISNKSVTLRSSDGAGSTSIMGSPSSDQRGIVINGSGVNCIVDGFRVTGCSTGGGGGGVLIGDNAAVTLRNMEIVSNSSVYDGAGMNCGGAGQISLENCLFQDNTAGGYGGGIQGHGSGFLQATNCQFIGNSANTSQCSGGGVCLTAGMPGEFDGCEFQGNSARYGGGLYAEFVAVSVSGCTFDSNTAVTAGASQGGAIASNDVAFTITNCSFSNNTSEYIGGAIACDISSPDQSTYGTLDLSNSTFDANQASDFGGAVEIHGNSSGGASILQNCTFTDNSALGSSGGGLACDGGGGTTLLQCTFEGNSSNAAGGGATITNCDSVIEACQFLDNEAPSNGGGLYAGDGHVSVMDCTFLGNISENVGGGLWLQWPGAGSAVADCTIGNNTATSDAGGAGFAGGTVTVSVTTFCDNDPNDVSGSWSDGGNNDFLAVCSELGACCTNDICIITGDVDCLTYGGQWLGSDTSCDDCPPIIEPDPVGACCINGACILSTNVDCFAGGGSYAGDDVACADAGCPEVCPGDLTGDNDVTIIDLLIVIANWGPCP